MPKPKARKPDFIHYNPPKYLSSPRITPNKLKSIHEKTKNLDVREGEFLPIKYYGHLHPLLRERLPAHIDINGVKRGPFFEEMAEEMRILKASRQAKQIGIPHMQHMPTLVGMHEFNENLREPGDFIRLNMGFKHPEADIEGARLRSASYITKTRKGNYLVLGYGTQGSTKLAQLDRKLRKESKGNSGGSQLHRVYDYAIPAQTLAILSRALPRAGNPEARVFVTGQGLATLRRGTGREYSREALEGFLPLLKDNYGITDTAKYEKLLKNWQSTDPYERDRVLSTLPFRGLFGIPTHILDDVYHKVPSTIASRKKRLFDVATPEVVESIFAKDPQIKDPKATAKKAMDMDVFELDAEKTKALDPFIKVGYSKKKT